MKIPVIGWAISLFTSDSDMGNNMVKATDKAADVYDSALKAQASTDQHLYWAIVVGGM